MLNSAPYYNKHLKNSITAFGRVFSGIQIIREHPTDALLNQTLDIPINYAPKEKWLVRIDSDPTLENQVHTVLPLMSFEISGIDYDAPRKLPRMKKIVDSSATSNINPTVNKTFTPVPYNITMSLYILSKTQEDNMQILEQILPVFTPEYTVSSTAVPDLNLKNDIPIILQSVSIDDEYEGDFQTRRFITTTLTFTIKINLFRGMSNVGIINTVIANVQNTADMTPGFKETFTSVGTTPAAPTTDSWLKEF